MAADTVFAREHLNPTLWGELLPLLLANHDEAVAAPDVPQLDVDVERYELLDSVKALHLFTARDAGELVGYASFFAGRSIRYRTQVVATHDVVYVRPSHRGSTGLRLLCFADRELARAGVHLCRHWAKPEAPFGVILERLGYHTAEVTFEKQLSTRVHDHG